MQVFKTKRAKTTVAALAMLSVLGAACGDDNNDDAAAPKSEQNQPVSTARAARRIRQGHRHRSGHTPRRSHRPPVGARVPGRVGHRFRPAGRLGGLRAVRRRPQRPDQQQHRRPRRCHGLAYGPDVQKAFDGLWRSEKHIPQFVAYTQATAKGDKAGQDTAVTQLKAYAKEFGTTINSVNDKLPADVVEGAIVQHATELIAVINAQKAGDQPAVFSALRTAYGHMAHTATALAGGTVAKFPDKFDGAVDSKASELRSGLNLLLREHVWLAGSATGAALAVACRSSSGSRRAQRPDQQQHGRHRRRRGFRLRP